jgi:ADP-dependent NAD(P)H-hydrate dehydratase
MSEKRAKRAMRAESTKQSTHAENAKQKRHAENAEPRRLTAGLLREMPLPSIDGDDDKEERGRVLVIGGSVLVPGAMLLAGVAVLRAGAGKLQLATVRDAAIPLGFSVPEAMVIGLPVSHDGEIDPANAVVALRDRITQVDAVLVGPGMLDDANVFELIRLIVPALNEKATLVLDGVAVVALRHDETLLHSLNGRAVLTPHPGEMASLMGAEKSSIDGDPRMFAERAAASVNATIALKGAQTWIASPSHLPILYRDGVVGLGTSGSGDTLAGIVTGLAARGAPARTAAAWGVWAHGTAGRALTKRVARVGFLARELLAEVPALVGR